MHMEAGTAPMPDIILEAGDLSRHFGGLRAVDGVNLQVEAGALVEVGLIRPLRWRRAHWSRWG